MKTNTQISMLLIKLQREILEQEKVTMDDCMKLISIRNDITKLIVLAVNKAEQYT